jgi:hypothetical protein
MHQLAMAILNDFKCVMLSVVLSSHQLCDAPAGFVR